MASPLINGINYSWSQIATVILGVPVVGITSIEYEDKQEIVDHYGAGSFVTSRGFGKVETMPVKISLYMDEVEPLQLAAPLGRLENIPEFDIIVAFIPTSGTVATHTLKNCRFMGNKRTIKQGDTSVIVDLELKCSHILWTL